MLSLVLLTLLSAAPEGDLTDARADAAPPSDTEEIATSPLLVASVLGAGVIAGSAAMAMVFVVAGASVLAARGYDPLDASSALALPVGEVPLPAYVMLLATIGGMVGAGGGLGVGGIVLSGMMPDNPKAGRMPNTVE